MKRMYFENKFLGMVNEKDLERIDNMTNESGAPLTTWEIMLEWMELVGLDDFQLHIEPYASGRTFDFYNFHFEDSEEFKLYKVSFKIFDNVSELVHSKFIGHGKLTKSRIKSAVDYINRNHAFEIAIDGKSLNDDELKDFLNRD